MRFSCLKKESLAFIRSGLAVSCVLLAASLLAGVIAGPFSAREYKLFYIAVELYRMPLAILLVTNIAAAITEERL